MIPISKPYLNKEILKYAHDALDSTWISSNGEYIQKATDKLKEISKTEYVLLTNNGTSAMHLVSKCLQKFKGGQSILVPDNVYVAAWNAFLYDNYYFIRPVRSDLSTWNVDTDRLVEIAKDGDHILIVHNLGNIINVYALKQKLPKCTFVEDNCEGFHYFYSLSKDSLCGGISFYGNKIFTSGEGGAFLCHDKEVYDYAKKLLGQGQTDEKFIHDSLGYNYRMTNIQAAILLGQLENRDFITNKRNEIFSVYNALFKNIPVKLQKKTWLHSQWMYGIRIPDNKSYQKAKTFFDEAGIETRPMFYPMSTHKHLKIYADELEEHNSIILNNEVILLPTYPELTIQEQEYIAEKVKEYVG